VRAPCSDKYLHFYEVGETETVLTDVCLIGRVDVSNTRKDLRLNSYKPMKPLDLESEVRSSKSEHSK
jgi:hypothetical protein